MSTILHLHLLGGLRLLAGDTSLTTVNTPRLQALVACLALHRDAPIARQHLAYCLWPDSTNVQARTNLRNLLHLLRRAWPEADRLLDDTGPLLRWRPDAPVTLDVADFERAVAQAEQAERAGNQPSARATLERALALYRGPLLPSCYDDWIVPERERLHQLFVTAAERLLMVLEGEGDYRRAIGYAQQLLHHEPLDEATYRRLLRLHAWSGDRTGALRVYRTCETVLERELGVAPSPATRELYERLLKGEVLPRPAGAAAPPERLARNLPLALTSFIGREPALAEVRRRLAGTRLLTLTGPGGCGKTRLAMEVATALVEEYADGVWWVELAELTDPALVPQAVAVALGVREQPGQALLETLVTAVRGKELLLLLDNCEHVVAAAAQLAERLLQVGPRLRVLATSREGLGLAGEVRWPVPPLAAPSPEHQPGLAVAAEQEAVRLFAARAASALPTFRLTEGNVAMVAQICWRLDGIPLAIELAAARVRMLTVEQLAGRLDAALSVLSSGTRTGLPRHQAMRAAIDWSYALLPEPERALLRRLAVFAGGFTLDAAERVGRDEQAAGSRQQAVGSGGEAEPPATPSVLDLLAHLIDKSLVLVVDQEAAPSGEPEARYRLLEIVRQYGWERLVALGEAEAIQRRHAAYCLALAEAAEPHLDGPRNGVWMDRLAQEHGNFREALRWAEAPGEVETSLKLAGLLLPFWWQFGYLSEGRAQLTAALARADGSAVITTATGAIAYARALVGAGWLAVGQGDFPVARALLVDGLAHWRATGHQPGIARACYSLGMAAVLQGEYESATPLLEESLARWRVLGHRPGVAWTLESLAYLTGFQGDLAATSAHLEAGLAACGDEASSLRARLLVDSGILAVLQADHATAHTRLAAGLAMAAAVRDTWGLLLGLDGWAMLAAIEGRPERALRLAAAAASRRETAGALLPGAYEALRERVLAPARLAMGEVAGPAAWAAGRALSFDQAVAEALGPAVAPAGALPASQP